MFNVKFHFIKEAIVRIEIELIFNHEREISDLLITGLGEQQSTHEKCFIKQLMSLMSALSVAEDNDLKMKK